MDEINRDDVFIQDDAVYGKQVKAVPKPEKNIGIDTNNELVNTITEAIEDNIVTALEKSAVDSKYNTFNNKYFDVMHDVNR